MEGAFRNFQNALMSRQGRYTAYFDTFKQVGFVIENNNGYFRIDKENSTAKDISQLLHFTEEEAFSS